MQRPICALALIFLAFSCGGSPDYSGDYESTYMGQSLQLHLMKSDGGLRGKLTYAGVSGEVQASVVDDVAKGHLNAGPMGSFPFEATLNGDQGLHWKYLIPLPGQAQALELDFTRSAGNVAASESSGLDRQLVGVWRRTISNSVPGMRPSDNMNVSTDIHCTLSADGRFSYGGAVTGVSSQDFVGMTDGGGMSTGHWKTEGGVLYSQVEGQSNWTPLGRYSVSGGAMVLYVGNAKQLWERQF